MKTQALKRKAKAPDIIDRAIRTFNEGDSTGAETLARRAMKKDPGNPDALHLLGMAAYTRSDLDRAETLISRALSRRPDSGPYHYSLGLVHVARQN
ncbi:MAG: tetratricopeptide repeat protein, partial [Deltaproteobacteria bacterium]|nr:tetratricopeptide repeat protein [Deltaproteobacteria bacterium]